MKTCKYCPKCMGESIIHVPGRIEAYGNGCNIKVGMTNTSMVPVDRYICETCGHVEFWVANKAYLDAIKKRYVNHDDTKMYPWNK